MSLHKHKREREKEGRGGEREQRFVLEVGEGEERRGKEKKDMVLLGRPAF